MSQRSGLENVLAAIAGISAVVAVGDLVKRQKSAREALERHRQTITILNGINDGLKKLNDKLSK